MSTAQDHAFALLVAQRGTVTPEGLAQARALVAQRAGQGQTLAQALLELRLLGPGAVAEALRELTRASFVCEPCHELRAYDGLARLPALQCPHCGRAMVILHSAPLDSRPASPLGDTAVGGPLGSGRLPPARPRAAVDLPSRPSGAFVVPARPSGTYGALPAASGPTPGDARTIGPYTIVRELGRGSNGVVYLAKRPGLARTFAVKVLLRGDDDPEGVRRFQLEATVASKIEDPGIIGVFDVGRHAGHDYYAMDYCQGATLEERLRRGPLPPAEAARVIEQLARTVQAAHRVSVIHRDLKPANVILEQDSGRPRILDFGLARDRTQVQSLTRSGDVVGTPYYMAPEQIRGDRDLDHRIDVYALGVILYECLTGRRPFEATSVIELAQKIRGQEPPPPRALQPGLPARLEDVCLKAIAKNRDLRHPTARHLADELAAFGAPRRGPADAPADDDAPSGSTPRRPPPLVWLAGGALVAVGLAAAALSVAPRRSAEPPAARATDGAPPGVTRSVTRSEEVARLLARARSLARERASIAVVQGELDRALEAAAGDPARAAGVRLERAALLSRRGRHAEALLLASALSEAADAPTALRAEALRILAQGQELTDDARAARATWSRLREVAPEGPPASAAAAALARLEDDVGAREVAARAAREAPSYPPALLERAAAELRAGDAFSALEAATRAVEAWPDDAAAHLAVGLARSAGRDLAGARVALDDAVRLGEPEPDLRALTTRARVTAEVGQLEAAQGDLERVLRRAPRHQEAMVLRGVVLWALAAVGETTQRRAAAEAAWRQAHDVNPEVFLRLVDPLPAQVRAAARQAAGVLPGTRVGERAPVTVGPEAHARLERWTQGLEEAARRPLLQALIAAAEGQPLPRFEPHLREASQAAPDSARVALLVARLFAGRDAYDAALEALERARALGAPPPALDLLHGEVLWFRGQGNDAVKMWDALAHRAPTDPHALTAAAWAYFAREDAPAAIRSAAEALHKQPDLTAAHLIQGQAHAWSSQFAEAEACYERVLALEGAVFGRAALFEVDAELDPLITKVGWRGASTPEIDARMERLISLFHLGGATTRLVAVNNALQLGPGTPWFGRCHEWLDEAQRAEPHRGELDMWHGWVALQEPGSTADDVLRHWLRAREKQPRIVLSRSMRQAFKQRFGDHPALEEFPEK